MAEIFKFDCFAFFWKMVISRLELIIFGCWQRLERKIGGWTRERKVKKIVIFIDKPFGD